MQMNPARRYRLRLAAGSASLARAVASPRSVARAARASAGQARGLAAAAAGHQGEQRCRAPGATPTRIVSLSDASTEDLFAVGAGRQVVAVDEYSTYPRERAADEAVGL